MTNTTQSRRLLSPCRLVGWGTIIILLLLPAVLRFPWGGGDFVLLGVLLGSVGVGIEFLARLRGNISVRLGGAMLLLTCFLTVWVNLAVGMIGDDNPYNLLFGGVLLVGLAGSILARSDPRKTASVMLLAAALQVAAGLGGYGQDPRGAIFSTMFGGLWLLAAALFRAGASR